MDKDHINNQDASIRFILDILARDNRLDELSAFMVDGYAVAGIEGEPGWILERRDLVDEGDSALYPDWPVGAHFRSYVDPEFYNLKYPEFFMTKEKLMSYIK